MASKEPRSSKSSRRRKAKGGTTRRRVVEPSDDDEGGLSESLRSTYDLVVHTLLKGFVLVALLGWLIHLAGHGFAGILGFDPDLFWPSMGQTLGVSPATLKLVLFGILHAMVLYLVWGPLDAVESELGRGWARLKAELMKVGLLPDRLRRAARTTGTVVASTLLAVLVLQPTLVPLRLGTDAWIARGANLVDGTASMRFADSVVAVARAFYAEPVQGQETVGPEDFNIDLDADEIPLMDRWDPYLTAAAEGDDALFAQTKAVMWVESGGRQYALSATGCAGLMQFCAGTAQTRPFNSIFGVGQVAACGCRDCGVPREAQVELETDPEAVHVHAETFPCNLADARFDGDRSIRAGVAYIDQLRNDLGGNLLLVYIGYNSGPSIARKLYQTLGKPQGKGGAGSVTVEDLRPHLAKALRPVYGSRADGRAAGLLDVHLPKLLAAYNKWER